MIDSGANCNLILNEDFQSLTLFWGVVSVTLCSKQVFPYFASQALDLVGSGTLNVAQTRTSKHAEFCIIPGRAATLLGREVSEFYSRSTCQLL